MDYIERQVQLCPDLAEDYEKLGNLFARKLWHELSIAVKDIIQNPKFQAYGGSLEFFQEFVTKFESRINQVHLARIVSLIGQLFHNSAQAIEFFQSVLAARGRLGPEASLCIDVDIITENLKLGLFDESKQLLEDVKERLAAMNSPETIVYSKFYGATAEYKKRVGPPQDFYKAALMFLAYTPLDEMASEQKYVLATDMALAAVTGEGIYNFGEAISTPILQFLQGTPNEWLRDLVVILNKGDIDAFNLLIGTNREAFQAQPALTARNETIKKKIVFLCLMNMVFERHSHDRTISFSDIAARTRLPLLEVEWVLMQAMSLGLIRGVMDEVEQAIQVTWMQPRVLDIDQLKLLGVQLDGWTERAKTALRSVEDQTPELYV